MSSLVQHPGHEEERLQRVSDQLPCREVQAGTLLSLMGQVCDVMLVYTDIMKCCLFRFKESTSTAYCCYFPVGHSLHLMSSFVDDIWGPVIVTLTIIIEIKHLFILQNNIPDMYFSLLTLCFLMFSLLNQQYRTITCVLSVRHTCPFIIIGSLLTNTHLDKRFIFFV